MPTYRCAWPDLRLSRWLVGGYFLTYCINTLAARGSGRGRGRLRVGRELLGRVAQLGGPARVTRLPSPAPRRPRSSSMDVVSASAMGRLGNAHTVLSVRCTFAFLVI